MTELPPSSPLVLRRDDDGRPRALGGESPLLCTYLESDLQEDRVASQAMATAVRDVLEGRRESHAMVGNACSVQLDCDQVLLESLHTEQEDRLRTTAFQQALDAWCDLLED